MAAAAGAAQPVRRLRAMRGDVESEFIEKIMEAARQVQEIGSGLGEIADRLPLTSQVQLTSALDLMGIAVTAMFACVDKKCDWDGLPPSPIESRPRGPNRDLIQRCRHDPPHCWDGNDKNIPCP